MSRKRQRGIYEPLADTRSEVRTLAREYSPGHVIPLHFHNRHQLVYASCGVMTVHTSGGTWVVPAHRAVWIPAGVPHTITMSGAVAMRTLYLKPRLSPALPRDCCVLNVSALLKELILRACAFGSLKKRIERQRHLLDLILDEMEEIEMVPLHLPNPSDARALRVARALAAEPGGRRRLREICESAGASKRTVERIFQRELGMTLGKWRQQLRLMQALRFLAGRAKVTHAALEAGYSTPSAFVVMFRKALGTTPTRYFRAAVPAGFRGSEKRRKTFRRGAHRKRFPDS
jgi:AraC-like DNA-binding protein/mannose-6-phosphate isomerase-like protein (cupin superfamily)